METLNLDLLLNAYKEENKVEETRMEFLIEFSDDEEEEICQKENEKHPVSETYRKENIKSVLHAMEENEEVKEIEQTVGCILPIMMVLV